MIFCSGYRLKKLKEQVEELAEKIQELQLQFEEIRQELGHTITIENVNVERVNVDRLEFSNNFGAMGIRELGGALNIGVNCWGTNFPSKGKTPKESAGKIQKQAPSEGHGRTLKAKKEQTYERKQDGPVCNIRYTL